MRAEHKFSDRCKASWLHFFQHLIGALGQDYDAFHTGRARFSTASGEGIKREHFAFHLGKSTVPFLDHTFALQFLFGPDQRLILTRWCTSLRQNFAQWSRLFGERVLVHRSHLEPTQAFGVQVVEILVDPFGYGHQL